MIQLKTFFAILLFGVNRLSTFLGSKMFKELTKAYLNWGVTASKYWSSYAMLLPYEDYFYFTIGDALFVGDENDGDDYWSLYNAMKDEYPENIITLVNETFDTYWEKASHQSPEPIYADSKMESLLSFLLNDSMAQSSDMVDDLIDNVGFFGCTLHPFKPCMASIQFLQTIPRDDDDVTNTAIPR